MRWGSLRIHKDDYEEEFDAPESLRPRLACAAALFRAIRALCSSVNDGGADTTAADVARGDSSSGGAATDAGWNATGGTGGPERA